jgi:acyl-CoA synthetase (AMP-forming)/AMP-acid ligase II
VTLTHGNMTFAADSIVEYLRMEESDRVLCVLPLSFDYGLYQLLMTVGVGGTLVLEHGFAFPGRVVQLLEAERITGPPGRRDDLIKSGGEKFVPRKIEDILHAAQGFVRQSSSASPTAFSVRQCTPTSRRSPVRGSTSPPSGSIALSVWRTTRCQGG